MTGGSSMTQKTSIWVLDLVNVYRILWKFIMFTGKIHYFDGHFPVRKLLVITLWYTHMFTIFLWFSYVIHQRSDWPSEDCLRSGPEGGRDSGRATAASGNGCVGTRGMPTTLSRLIEANAWKMAWVSRIASKKLRMLRYGQFDCWIDVPSKTFFFKGFRYNVVSLLELLHTQMINSNDWPLLDTFLMQLCF